MPISIQSINVVELWRNVMNCDVNLCQDVSRNMHVTWLTTRRWYYVCASVRCRIFREPVSDTEATWAWLFLACVLVLGISPFQPFWQSPKVVWFPSIFNQFWSEEMCRFNKQKLAAKNSLLSLWLDICDLFDLRKVPWNIAALTRRSAANWPGRAPGWVEDGLWKGCGTSCYYCIWNYIQYTYSVTIYYYTQMLFNEYIYI